MRESKFDKDGFSLMPTDINEDVWFYDGKKGLTLVVRHGLGIRAVTTIIPWRKLLPPVARYNAYQKRMKNRKAKVKSR